MRRFAYRFRAATNRVGGQDHAGTLPLPCPRRDGRIRPSSRAKPGNSPGPPKRRFRQSIIGAMMAAMIAAAIAAAIPAAAETRPRYGGTLRIMMQSAPNALNLSPATAPTEYWDIARALSLLGDTLVRLDPQGRPQPALALAWQSDAGGRHWQVTLRRGVRFHDGSAASPAA